MRRGGAKGGSPPDGLVPADWFARVAAWTLRRAFRRNEYVALVTIAARREFPGWEVDVGPEHLIAASAAVRPTIRETDLIGELTGGNLGLLVSDGDEATTCRLVQRIGDTFATQQLPTSLTFAIGAAICPTHGIDLTTLIAHAASHPMLNVRSRPVSVERLVTALGSAS